MEGSVVVVDGSQGEGGGQVLRTALSLSLVTGRPLHIVNIRARRPKPGLGNQHLTAVRAAARIGEAELQGDKLGSQELLFRPKAVKPGSYRFAVGTAGSCTLVLQTVLPPLLAAELPSELVLEGGTHNPLAPPFEFLSEAFLPLLRRMGPKVSAVLRRPGFYPRGGGRIDVTVAPVERIQPLELLERGDIRAVEVRAVVAGLPRSIAEREINEVKKGLRSQPLKTAIDQLPASVGPGNVLILTVRSENLTEVFTAFGRKGYPAERVARDLVREASLYLSSEAPVGQHLADQLLLPLALAGSGKLRTLPPTNHTRTNAAVIRQFLPVEIDMKECTPHVWEITVTREL